MANKRVTDLTQIPDVADGDTLHIVDVSNTDDYATGSSRKITIAQIKTAVGLQAHLDDTDNPHEVTKTQVGLGNVDNTSDANKPISDATQTALDAKADLVGGKIPTSQIPAIALTDVYVVADETEQLALTAQEGDIAVRTDENKSYAHNGGSAGDMTDWTELLTPTDSVLSVNGQTGAVTLTTTNISEGDNLYFTVARAISALTGQNISLFTNDAGYLTIDDVETTKTFSFTIENPTESETISLGAINDEETTITEVRAYTIGASTDCTFQLEERGETTPNTTGTSIMTASLVADTDQQSTTAFDNDVITGKNKLHLTTSAITGTPTQLVVEIDYIIN